MHSLESASLLSRIPLVVFLGTFICFFAIYIRSKRNTDNGIKTPTPTTETKTNAGSPSCFPITPLPEFNWETTEPLVLRPFKPKYHLTMGITTLNPSDLIPMDKTYLSRLSLRKQLLSEYTDIVRAVNIQSHDPRQNSEVRDALCEWYAFVMGEYLPRRYPRMFRLVSGSGMTNGDGEKKREQGTLIESLVTRLKAPVDPGELMRSFSGNATYDGEDPIGRTKKELLHLCDTLGTWIDEDFLILLPSPSLSASSRSKPQPQDNQDQEPKYHLQAYTTFYPSGFDTRTKLGKPLSEIHAPVPGYKQKLEKSMDRFFERLEVGKVVVRVNWSIMTKGTGLFAPFGGLHDHSPDSNTTTSSTAGDAEEDKIKVDGFDGDETYLRCERQTLHRLPRTKALVFAFHTYAYPIKDVRDEGLGEELAVAIDGLKEGSVPGIYAYKRGRYWGKAVKAFLRS
ncbi:hypothetical protein BDW62DRAFT_106829 [Aspergillus aurantiobrunneus]